MCFCYRVIEDLTLIHFALDKDENNWEVMSSLSSRRDRGYGRVMTRLLKKSNQLSSVGHEQRGKLQSIQFITLVKNKKVMSLIAMCNRN